MAVAVPLAVAMARPPSKNIFSVIVLMITDVFVILLKQRPQQRKQRAPQLRQLVLHEQQALVLLPQPRLLQVHQLRRVLQPPE